MKNITFPAKLGTLAMAAVLATTVHASAQAIPTETVDCEDCEITAVDEGVIFEPTDENVIAIDEAEPVYPHSTWPEVGEMAPELPEPVFVGLPVSENTEMDDGALAITSVNGEAPVAAQSGIAVLAATVARTHKRSNDSSDSEFDRPVVVANASNNLCLNKQMYVSFLCAWQGFERPLD